MQIKLILNKILLLTKNKNKPYTNLLIDIKVTLNEIKFAFSWRNS